jgi:hypothetical protein
MGCWRRCGCFGPRPAARQPERGTNGPTPPTRSRADSVLRRSRRHACANGGRDAGAPFDRSARAACLVLPE